MKTKKQKIEIEVEIENGYEFDRYGKPKKGEWYLSSSATLDKTNIDFDTCSFLIFKPIEPPLELETRNFIDTSLNIVDFGNMKGFNSPAEARDLAKILNYWAEKGRLPERVVVKEAYND